VPCKTKKEKEFDVTQTGQVNRRKASTHRSSGWGGKPWDHQKNGGLWLEAGRLAREREKRYFSAASKVTSAGTNKGKGGGDRGGQTKWEKRETLKGRNASRRRVRRGQNRREKKLEDLGRWDLHKTNPKLSEREKKSRYRHQV